MFFLLCVTIYLTGLATFGYLWRRRSRRALDRAPKLVTMLAMASASMLCLCALSSLLMVVSGHLVPGILLTISLILYHVTWIEPLFLCTVLGIVSWRSREALLQRRSLPLFIACALVFGASAIGVWSMYVEPYWLDLHHVEPLALDPSAPLPKELRVAVLADLQHDTITPFQRRIARVTMQERPDLILIPGDLYDSPAAEAHIEDFRALLATLSAPLGVFMVVGDHDRLEVLRAMTRGTQVVLLDDERARIWLDDTHAIEIVGLSSPHRDAFTRAMSRPAPSTSPGETRGVISRIVLVHRPRNVLYLRQQDDVSLVVAGHTHGDQINLPFLGPPVTLSPLPGHIAAGGLHDLGHTRLYISRGLGGVQQSVPLIRFNCRPELPILHVR